MADRGKAVYLVANASLTRNDFLQGLGGAGLRLPVAPLDNIIVTQNVNVNTNVLPLAGSVVFGGGPGLKSVAFSGLFPLDRFEPYAHPETSQYGYQSPNWYDEKLQGLAASNTIFDLVISDAEGAGSTAYTYLEPDARVVYHSLAMIDSYSVTDEEGGTLWYSISFTQYRPLSSKIVTVTSKNWGPEFYTVDALKTLEAIAKRYAPYGTTVKKLIYLNRKPGLPRADGGKKDKIQNGKQKIKKGTKVRLRNPKKDPSQASMDDSLIK